MHANHKRKLRQQQIRAQASNSDAYAFFNLLTGPQWFGRVESLLPVHRERLFPPTETLSMFLSQVLCADRSCQRAVNEFAVQRVRSGLSACSTHTGGYCRARERLPQELVSGLLRYTGASLSAALPVSWRWRGRAVRLVDGTTVSLPDTEANQAEYPQSRTQQRGLGYPLCRLLALTCLGSGGLLNAAVGRFRGGDEQTLLRTLLDTLSAGDVLVGDAYFATYFLLCSLEARGVDGVFEQYGARRRSTDFRRGERLGVRDHLLVWSKPARPGWMSAAEYAAAPDTLTVRELYTGGKVLVTTLRCARATRKAQLRALYRRRWCIELDLRDLKTTLGMERLRGLTPAMARKELWVYLLAYNLIRVLMAQAAVLAGCRPRELSFKHTLQLWVAWGRCGPLSADGAAHQVLFVLIAQQRVGGRPGRIEPRALKRRAKTYPLLTEPRARARDRIRQHGHPQKLKVK